MPRQRDTPCSRCGTLLWSGSTSLPAAERVCRPCRKIQSGPCRRRSTSAVTYALKPKACARCACDYTPTAANQKCCEACRTSRACCTCGESFRPHRRQQETCSLSCAQARRHGDASRRAICEVCGTIYVGSHAEQRTCGRSCGVQLRRRITGTLHAVPRPHPSCKVWAKNCAHCTQPFAARNVNQIFCSHICAASARPYVSKRKPRDCAECGSAVPATVHPHVRYCSEACRRVRKVVADRAQRRRERQAGKRESSHRARAKRFGVQYEPINKRTVYARDGWRCGLCRRKVDPKLTWPHPMSASLDHVLPMSRGGDHLYSNVQLAHLRCNVDKGCTGTDQLALIG